MPERRLPAPGSKGSALPRGNVIPENAVRRVEHREGGAAYHVAVGEVAAQQAVRPVVAALDQGRDDDVRVERPDHFDAHELERDGPFREGLEGTDGRFGAQAGVTGGAGLALRPSRDGLAGRELQRDLAGHAARGGALEREAGETQALAPYDGAAGTAGSARGAGLAIGHRRHLGGRRTDEKKGSGATMPR